MSTNILAFFAALWAAFVARLPSFEIGNAIALLAVVPLLALFLYLARTSRRGMRPQRAKAALYLRIGVLVLLVLALADLRVRTPADKLAVGFLVDVSDSVGSAARDKALPLIRDALQAAPSGDEAAVVAFAGDAYVESPPSPARDVPRLASNPARGATDLAAALRVGLGLLPTDRARRLVVLSDGNENREKAADEARVASAAGVPIDYVVVGGDKGPEVLVKSVDAPAALREGDQFSIRVTIDSTVEASARVNLITDGRLDEAAGTGRAAPTQLHPGSNTIVLPHDPLPSGFHTFRVQVEPGVDTIPENNEGTAFTSVTGKPRVLLVEGAAGEAKFLSDALRAGGVEGQVVPPTGLPADVAQLRGWDGVVLVNVPATALSPGQMRAVKDYVQTLGGGLTIVGGDHSYVLGGYQHTPLEDVSPLAMQRRGARAESSVALELVIDTSGSMGDNVGGMTKMDLAKESALNAIELLTGADQLGIIAFEDQPRTVVELAPLDNPDQARAHIRQMAPGGGTAIYPALTAAVDTLEAKTAKVKHVVLMTDGISPGGDYPGLAERMKRDNITLSTIGIGNDADVNLLQQLADMGGGRYYDGSDPFQVPQIVVKETLEIARTAIVEEPFKPSVVGTSPMLDGIRPDQMPTLRGYVAVTPKPASLVVLGTAQGDPLLTEWQYGLGEVVAWTSDAVNRWSADWIEWPEFSRFWSQVVKRTVPARVDQNLQTTVSVEGDRARVTVDALGDDHAFRNFLKTTATVLAPDGTKSDLPLDQVGPGRYQTTAPIGQPGAYMLQVVQRDPGDDHVVAQQSTGFVTNSSTEYWQLTPNRALLEGLARATGGHELAKPGDAFAHDLRAPGAGRELWPVFTALAAALFLADVAVRRLRVSFEAIVPVLERVRARLAPVRPGPLVAPRPGLARLLAAKQAGAAAGSAASARPGSVPAPASPTATLAARLAASRTASARVVPSAPAAAGSAAIPRPRVPTAPAPRPPAPRQPAGATPAAAGAGGSTAARLLAAKQRARQGGR
jgi:Mg-chelatase subunit ChlD